MNDYYFVAKTERGHFVGLLTLEDIAKRYYSGEISGTYAVTKSFGLSYAQLMKSRAAVVWSSVSDMVAQNPDKADIWQTSRSGNGQQCGEDSTRLVLGTVAGLALGAFGWSARLVDGFDTGSGSPGPGSVTSLNG